MNLYKQLLLELIILITTIILLVVFSVVIHQYRVEVKPNVKYVITDNGIVDSNYNSITVEQYDSLCTVFNYYYLNSANDRIKNKFNKLTDKY